MINAIWRLDSLVLMNLDWQSILEGLEMRKPKFLKNKNDTEKVFQRFIDDNIVDFDVLQERLQNFPFFRGNLALEISCCKFESYSMVRKGVFLSFFIFKIFEFNVVT